MKRLPWLFGLVMWACSEAPPDTNDASSDDAQPDIEAGPPPRCDTSKPFGTSTTDTTLSFNGHGAYASLSSDELTAYVSADIYGSCSIWAATRASNDVAFGQPALVDSLNGTNVQEALSLSQDGLMGAFVRLSTYSSNDGKIFVAQRATTSSAFGASQEQTSLDLPNSSNRTPYLSSDGSSLYFASNQSGAFELYVAHGNGGSFAGAQLVAFASPPTSDALSPVLSPDELTMYFSAKVGSSTGPHVQVAHRADKTSPFAAAQAVDPVNSYSAAADYPTWISTDGCVLYSYRVTYTNAYVANVMVAKRPL